MGVVYSTVSYLLGWEQYDADKVDEATGLSGKEKKAIRDSWALVSLDLKGNGVAFLVKFFKEYPNYQDFFDAFRGQQIEELKTKAVLRTHAQNVMSALTSLVDNLDDPECLVGLIQKTATNHYKRSVPVKAFEDIFVCFVDFLGEGLGDKCTPFTRDSWQKALTVICKVLGDQLNEEDKLQGKAAKK